MNIYLYNAAQKTYIDEMELNSNLETIETKYRDCRPNLIIIGNAFRIF